MNRLCLNSRSCLRASLLLLALSLASPGLAAEVALRAFSASYNLYLSGMHIAGADVSLQREDQLWRWRTKTAARGIYAWLLGNKIYSETTFIQSNDEIRIQRILNKDSNDKEKYEAASFDWVKSSINVLRKGKQKQLTLDAEIYDYHSIHLLAASMHMRQLPQATVDFYRKGKLTGSSLVYSGTAKIDINGETVDTNVYEHRVVTSRSKLIYYYDTENPLLLLQVEKFKPGKSPLTLTLSKIDWEL